ncbi:unnamed protein product [Scytosiphon promiscuus]
MTARPAILLWLLMAWTTRTTTSSAYLEVSTEPENWGIGTRKCTVDELLPLALDGGETFSSEWSEDRVADPLYGCDCAHSRARYFCPHLGDDGYQIWAPRAVSDGTCSSMTASQLAEAPFPPGFKVLVYGNSHLRQVVESMMCFFHEHISTKRIKYYVIGPGDEGDSYRTVEGSAQCRSCAPFNDELVDYECLSEGDAHGEACRCSDDISEFVFSNGAVLHYYFANRQKDKRVSDALPRFNVSSLSYYDVVIANNGNGPRMHSSRTLEAAAELQNASVPFLWLSTYDGRHGREGDVDGWKARDRERMEVLGAKYVRIGVMALGLDHLHKRVVEPRSGDSHFCLPGPPNEMALLLLKLVWAWYFEKNGEIE